MDNYEEYDLDVGGGSLINAADEPSTTCGAWKSCEFLTKITVDTRGALQKNNLSLKNVNVSIYDIGASFIL